MLAGSLKRWLLLSALLTLTPPFPAFSAHLIVINPLHIELPAEQDYPHQLLQAALAATATEGEVVVARFPLQMTQSRIIHELARAGAIDVGVLASGHWQHPQLRPILIPIRRGLLGWRLLVSRPERVASIRAHLWDGAPLRSLTTGFGEDWVDLGIMRANFAHVAVARTSQELYQRLGAGEFDFYSLSAVELWREVGVLNLDLTQFAIVPDVALYYPLADFFYVHRDQKALAQRIERGLAILYENGELEALLEQFHGEDLRRSHLSQRRIFQLTDPGSSLSAPPIAAHWWYKPDQ